MTVTIKTLGTVATYINGRAFKPAEWKTKGTPIIRIQNLTNEDAPYNYSTEEYEEKYLVKNGDLLFAWSASLGAHIWRGHRAWLNQHIFRVIPNDDISRDYLYYYLLTVVAELYSKTHGSGMVHITKAPFMNMPIPVPPLSEQERIVSRVEELFSQLDAGVETLKKIKAQLAVYRQAVLKDAFEGIKTFTPLGTITDRIFDGPFGTNLKTADYTDSGVRVVRLENLKNAWFDDGKKSFVTVEKYETIKAHTVIPSDLIMSTFISESIKICQLPSYIGYAVNKADCVGIRLKPEIIPQFIMYYMSSKRAYNDLIHQVHGATRPRVNTKQIKAMRVPFTGTKEQETIVSEIESRLSVCDNIERTVDTALQQAAAMRQSILKDAFEGKL